MTMMIHVHTLPLPLPLPLPLSLSLSLSLLPLSLTYPMPDLLYIIIELVQLFVSRFLQLESLLLTLDRLIMCRL